MNIKGHTGYLSKTNNETFTVQQHPNVFGAFKKLFDEVKPKRILEIGTSYGGLTQFMRDYLDEIGLTDTTVKSFDIKEYKSYPEMRKSNIDVIVDNIFTHPYNNLAKPELVEGYIQSEGCTIVLCDGGSKKSEFRLLSQFLKDGDIIMAHDYIDTEENFLENYKDKIWNWREIGDEHINETCEKYNLVSFMKETFDPVVWACKMKK